MIGRQKCTDCGRLSPETNGEITLTTSFGWRVRRATSPTGEAGTEWRCPSCWQKYKAQQQTPTSDAATTQHPPSSSPKEPGKR